MFYNKSNKISSGFTITELIVVIGIMLIIFSIGIPIFSGLQRKEKLSGGVRNLVTDIRYAQQLAITEQLYNGIKFIPVSDGQDEYELFRYSSSTNMVIIKSKKLPVGIKFKSINFDNDAVVFNPYGASNEYGFVVLGNSDSSSTIEVRPSGFVKIIK